MNNTRYKKATKNIITTVATVRLRVVQSVLIPTQSHHHHHCTDQHRPISIVSIDIITTNSINNTPHNNNKSSQVNYQEDGQHERLIQLVRNRSLRTQPNRARVQHKQPADHHTQPAATLTLTLTLATTTTTGRTRTRLPTAALPQSPRDPISQGHL
jgi:hypothetical protein